MLDTRSYTYGDTAWGDLLTEYDGRAIDYDEIGNPLNDGVWTYTWEHGRQLASMTSTSPVIIEQQPEDYAGIVGDTAVFTVSATGEGLLYQWQYSSDGGIIWDNSSSSGNTTNTLSLAVLAYRNGNLYRCVVTDRMGHRAISHPGQVIVLSGTSVMSATAQTLQITDQPDDYYGIYGDTATFEVAATGSGLTYQWEYSDTDGEYWWPSTAQGATTNTLTIAHTEQRVGYLYRCIITDASGNTVTSRNAEIKLATYGTWDFTYNADGLRTSRTNGSATYSYVYIGSQLSQMTVGNDVLYFAYDASGSPMAVTYNGTNYYYATNLQGDVTAILNTSGTAVVEYTYDAWGNHLTTTGTMAETLGAVNPLRYRGYVYDTETTLYYLQSRYYDPEMGRFINADSLVSTGQGVLGNNMFAYCGNNPVTYYDPTGTLPKFLQEFIDGITDWVDTPLGLLKYVTERTKKGDLYEYWVAANAKVRWSRHHSNHGNAEEHKIVPHDHEWHEDEDGTNWQDPNGLPPDPGFHSPESSIDNSAKIVAGTIGTVAVGYAVYVGVKWIVATLAAPATGGGSLIVAGVTP